MPLNIPRQQALILTRGGMFDRDWPAIGEDYPAGSTTSIKFADSSGALITEITGTVYPKSLGYKVAPELVDIIPAGSHYELFLQTPDGPYKLEYGLVIRREAQFYTPPPTSLQAESRLFVDTFGRDVVGRRWVPILGRPCMHQPQSGVWGMGVDIGLLFIQCGVRYFRPLGGDSFRARFKVWSNNSSVGPGGVGKMRFAAANDAKLTTGVALEIETGVSNRFLRLGKVTAPATITPIGSAVSSTTVTNDEFVVEYSDITKALKVFKNGATTPILSWSDSGGVLPRGPGYRYFSFSWDASLVATGALLTDLEVQDYV